QPDVQVHFVIDAPTMPVPTGGELPIAVVWTASTAGDLRTTVTVTTDVEGAETWVVEVNGHADPIPTCDDGNVCTSDAFDRQHEICLHENNEASCNDGSACTRDDRCSDGACRGFPIFCDDQNMCTRDLCDPATGCVFVPDPTVC